MKYSSTCAECNRQFTIEYDESDGTLSFCPFCGEESAEGDTIEDALHIDSDEQWEESSSHF